MALQSPFFGKRDADTAPARHAYPNGAAAVSPAPASGASPSAVPSAPAAPLSSVTPAVRSTATAPAVAAPAAASPSKLTVGPNIKLKGVEITDCDTLVVEGMVEATMDSRVIHIAEQGAFTGSADIDIAEIHGVFDGTLTVREKLVVYATGRVTGKVRYGRLVVEDGGQLTGDIGLGAGAASRVTATEARATA